MGYEPLFSCGGFGMTSEVSRPEFCTEEMLDYLDKLRASGVTNMFGAGEYLENAFPELENDRPSFHSSKKARDVLMYWMKTFPRNA